MIVAEDRYPAECKRVSSLNSLRRRLSDGKAKLNRLMQEGSPPGVIAVDLTRPIRMAHSTIEVASDEQFLREAERRLIAYLREHVMTERNIASLECPQVLGVMARCLSAGAVGGAANIRRSVVWHGCSVHGDDSPEDVLFRRVARAFGPGELREGTLEEIIDATAQVDVIPNRRR